MRGLTFYITGVKEILKLKKCPDPDAKVHIEMKMHLLGEAKDSEAYSFSKIKVTTV